MRAVLLGDPLLKAQGAGGGGQRWHKGGRMRRGLKGGRGGMEGTKGDMEGMWGDMEGMWGDMEGTWVTLGWGQRWDVATL